MARKASTPKIDPMPEINQEAFQEDMNAVGVLGAIAQGMHEERDLVNQLLGQVQMADSFAKFSATVAVSKMAHVKENKLYRALKGQKNRDGRGFSGTWEEFCELLGTSAPKVNEDISNLRQFGEEALESMSRMGIGYRELRQWRKLPDDARSALIEAAKQGNKDAVEYLAEELIATHTKEKAALEKKVEDLEGSYEAQGRLLANTTENLQNTKLDLEKARRHVETMTVDQRATELREEVTSLAYEVEIDIMGKLRKGFAKLTEQAEEYGGDHRAFQAALVIHLESLLETVRSEFNLPEQLGVEEASDWMTADMDALDARFAGKAGV
ncbi:TPA: hypothetical protein ACWV9D_000459 [Pseudomonas aeruginosa]